MEELLKKYDLSDWLTTECYLEIFDCLNNINLSEIKLFNESINEEISTNTIYIFQKDNIRDVNSIIDPYNWENYGIKLLPKGGSKYKKAKRYYGRHKVIDENKQSTIFRGKFILISRLNLNFFPIKFQ